LSKTALPKTPLPKTSPRKTARVTTTRPENARPKPARADISVKTTAPKGRPIKFDADVQLQYVALLRVGCSRGAAARLVGVSRFTVCKLAKRDPQIAAALVDAERQCLARALKRISRAGKTNWRAAAWLIEWQAGRRRPGGTTTGKGGKPTAGKSMTGKSATRPQGIMSNILTERIDQLEAARMERFHQIMHEATERAEADPQFDRLAFLEAKAAQYVE